MAEQEDSQQPEEMYMVAADGNLWAMVESFRWPVGRQQVPGKHASSCCYSKTRRVHDIGVVQEVL